MFHRRWPSSCPAFLSSLAAGSGRGVVWGVHTALPLSLLRERGRVGGYSPAFSPIHQRLWLRPLTFLRCLCEVIYFLGWYSSAFLFSQPQGGWEWGGRSLHSTLHRSRPPVSVVRFLWRSEASLYPCRTHPA